MYSTTHQEEMEWDGVPFNPTSNNLMVTYINLCKCMTRSVQILQVLVNERLYIVKVKLFLCVFTSTGMKKNRPENKEAKVRTSI